MISAIMRILTRCCLIFSVLMLVLAAGISVIGIEKGFGIDHTMIFALFIFSFVIACSNVIYSVSSLSGALKYILHLMAVLISSAVFLKVVNGLDGKTILVAIIVIAIVHASVFIILNAIKKAKKTDEKYENVYKKDN